ncbi:unnamed protein product [Nippostrongylus brasiliensis]|uniref:ETS domain-containing protein n=1 Tax=Nippostrongylus brasiliensis TaxID=27835 RepID=A0A0N4Y7D9_NIPBR|nr:unnamed protein product [Nippostrongylus brasiliensis]
MNSCSLSDRGSDGCSSPSTSECSSFYEGSGSTKEFAESATTKGTQSSSTNGFFPFSPEQFFLKEEPLNITESTLAPLKIDIPSSPTFSQGANFQDGGLVRCVSPSTSEGTIGTQSQELANTKLGMEEFFKQDFSYSLTPDTNGKRGSAKGTTSSRLRSRRLAKVPDSPYIPKQRRTSLMMDFLVELLSDAEKYNDVIGWTLDQPLEFIIRDKKRFTAMWNKYTGKQDSFMSISCVMRAMGREIVHTSGNKRTILVTWTASCTYRFFPEFDMNSIPMLSDSYLKRLQLQLIISYRTAKVIGSHFSIASENAPDRFKTGPDIAGNNNDFHFAPPQPTILLISSKKDGI